MNLRKGHLSLIFEHQRLVIGVTNRHSVCGSQKDNVNSHLIYPKMAYIICGQKEEQLNFRLRSTTQFFQFISQKRSLIFFSCLSSLRSSKSATNSAREQAKLQEEEEKEQNDDDDEEGE